MAKRQCFHCKAWVEPGDGHDCWTTAESALTRGLSEDLREAWERLRETAADFGDQRIYASHHSIMFARKACYLFVRPKPKYLEVCVFLGRALKDPRVRKPVAMSKTKWANLFRIVHRDEVEGPIADWMREAYEFAELGGCGLREGLNNSGSADEMYTARGSVHPVERQRSRTTR